MPARFLLPILMLLALAATAQAASTYDFLAAPEIDLNRVYRLDRVTGEIGACQYGIYKEGSVGITLCYKPGEGATAQAPGEYALLASHHEKEGGVFRLDMRSGAVSICYVLSESVVCTPPGR